MKCIERAKVLIVENEDVTADHVASLLFAAGYEVVGTAQSSEEALEKLRECEPDLVLIDIHIKGLMDGIQTTTAMREVWDVPVIYLTAHSDQKTVARAKLTGESGFVTKPIHQAALGHAIEGALYKYRASRQIRDQQALIGTILGVISDPVIVINHRGKVQTINGSAERLIGWRTEAARQMDIALVLPLARAQSDRPADEVFSLVGDPRTASLLPGGLIASKHSGQWFPIDGEIVPTLEGEKVIGAVIRFRDATNGRTAEAELRQSQKMQQVGRIAAEVAHDFNKEALTVRKFKDRATAVSRIWMQIQTLEAPAPEPVRKPRQATGKKAAAPQAAAGTGRE
jgi:CheY-like chemotaxis protein